MFHNRTSEVSQLITALSRTAAQFVVLYGRRRCGKSTLIRQVLDDEGCYHLAVQGEEALQRQLFSKTIDLRFPGFSLAEYRNWSDFFQAIVQRGGKRFTLVIDEFPYLAKTSPSLASILQHLLEDRAKLNFHLILCGSSQQMMEDAVLSATAPLYGRADEILKIIPLAAGYLQDHLPDSSPNDLIREFAVWGGVPRYWELRSRSSSLSGAVQELLLRPTGLLKEEPRRLLLDDVRSLIHPFSLLTLIAGGCNRLSEIGGRLQKPAAELSRPLRRLIDLGYVVKEQPYGAPPRSGKQTYYRVADPFMRFYHRFILPDFSRIEMGRGTEVWEEIEGQLNLFVSQSWEVMCGKAISSGMAGKDFTDCKRWWGKTKTGQRAEIDLVARSADGKRLLLGECKWSDLKQTKKLHQRLRDLAPTLPFYQGEEVLTVVAARSGGDFGPVEVLGVLR
ncbi:MAG: AAA+ ATPase superfamily predicted ATPase [Neolewinella sp.]|jgi:AAA+ ATPase superfamily predicted ATPase